MGSKISFGGSGTVGGSTGATDNAILRADGAGGATAQTSLDTISDTGELRLPANIYIKWGEDIDGIRYVAGTGLQILDAGTSRILSIDVQSLSASRTVTVPNKAGVFAVLAGDLNIIGFTSSALPPALGQYPTDKDCGIHKDTNTGTVYLAYNDGGAIKTVTLT